MRRDSANMPNFPWPRTLHAVGFTLCVSALLIAILFMERYLGLAPCPLCVLDRIVVGTMALVFALAFVHDPAAMGNRIYAGVNAALGLLGIAIAARHVYLQGLPPGEVPDCTPDLGYMLENFPAAKTLSIIFNASGECAEITWTFFGLSIAQQTLLLFIALVAINVAVILTAGRRKGRV